MRYGLCLLLIFGTVATSSADQFLELLASYGNLSTVAGAATIRDKDVSGWQDSMEGGPAVAAELSRPHMAMADSYGNIFIADKDADAVRRINSDGTIETVAGINVAGYDEEVGLGSEISLDAPNGLYTLPDGTTYILDLGNGLIRKLAVDGQISTVVDDPRIAGTTGRGLWVSPDESQIYYSVGNTVKSWTPDGGDVELATGFNSLGNFDMDPRDNNLVVTDRLGHRVYKVFADGETEVIAGNGTTSGGGSGQLAEETGLNEVRGIAFHPDGGYLLATHDAGQVWFVDDSDIIHLLINGDDDHSHCCDGQPLTTNGLKISEPRSITIAPNRDLIITESDFGYIRVVDYLEVAGDFDWNREVDAADIDLLSTEIAQSALTGNRPSGLFDLNGDAIVDAADRNYWIEEVRGTFVGDANLDGEFNSTDFVAVFQAGHYEDQIASNSTWSTGDWNGDGEFDSGDFVAAFQAGGYEQGPRETPNVPEPASQRLLLIAMLFMGQLSRSILKRQ